MGKWSRKFCFAKAFLSNYKKLQTQIIDDDQVVN